MTHERICISTINPYNISKTDANTASWASHGAPYLTRFSAGEGRVGKMTKKELAYKIAVLELSEHTRTSVTIKDIQVKGAEVAAEIILKGEDSGGTARYRDRKYRLPMLDSNRAFNPILFGVEGAFLQEKNKHRLRKVYGGIIPEKKIEKFGNLQIEWISVPDVNPYARGDGVNFFDKDSPKRIFGFIHGSQWDRESRKKDQRVRVFILAAESPKWGNPSAHSNSRFDDVKECVRIVLDEERVYGEIKNGISALVNA